MEAAAGGRLSRAGGQEPWERSPMWGWRISRRNGGWAMGMVAEGGWSAGAGEQWRPAASGEPHFSCPSCRNRLCTPPIIHTMVMRDGAADAIDQLSMQVLFSINSERRLITTENIIGWKKSEFKHSFLGIFAPISFLHLMKMGSQLQKRGTYFLMFR